MTRKTNRGGEHSRPQENSPEPTGGTLGAVEAQVRADIEALVTAHPMGESLAEMSYALARTLDEGAGLAVAAVNRELRANLVELARLGVNGDDDLDAALSNPVVPSQVRDTPES